MSGDHSEEIKNLTERYEASPGSRLFAPLADAYRKNGLLDKAIEICEEGLKEHPDYASAHVILGKCFYDKGATESSRTEFKRVLDIDGENLVALKFLADIFLAEGKRDEAAEHYKRLLAIDPTNEPVAKILEEIKQEFKVRDIDLEDSKAVKTAGHSKELATMTLAGIYASQGYYHKALDMYRDILKGEPGNKEAGEMVSKLEQMIDSGEKEREKAFEEDVMTISVEDIDSDLIENTSGHGFGERSGSGENDIEVARAAEELEKDDLEACDEKEAPPAEAETAEEAEEPYKAAENDSSGRDVRKETGSTMAGKESKDKKEGGDSPGGAKGNDMSHFQDWLRQMQEKHGKDD